MSNILIYGGVFYLLISCISTISAGNQMHPEFSLLDALDGRVLDSRLPASTYKTCGQCHDAEYIESHSFHVSAGNHTLDGMRAEGKDASDLNAESGIRLVGGGSLRQLGIDMNCFLCHLENPDYEARKTALSNNRLEWSGSASLLNTGILFQDESNEYVWNFAEFTSQGLFPAKKISLQAPSSENCGYCHVVVHSSASPLGFQTSIHDPASLTAKTGAIFSHQRISDSALNIKDKDILNRSWDIHAERLLNCRQCHFSLNNPIYSIEGSRTRPKHIAFDGRRQSLNEYLRRPSHHLARGGSNHPDLNPEFLDTMRRCESCHNVAESHAFLPYPNRHMSALSCESCHIPYVHFSAVESIDATVLNATMKAVVRFRGAIDDEISPTTYLQGFKPLLIPQKTINGECKLSPVNPIVRYRWVAGDSGKPLHDNAIQSIFFEEGRYRSEILDSFDNNGDGRLDAQELIIDSQKKYDMLNRNLLENGCENPRIEGAIEMIGVHHGVTDGKWAIRNCVECHAEDSRIDAAFVLAKKPPQHAIWRFADRTDFGETPPSISLRGETAWLIPQNCPERRRAHYISGKDRREWINSVGFYAITLVLAGIIGHGGVRIFVNRKRKGSSR